MGGFLVAYYIHPVGDRFGLLPIFYHADISVTTGFLIIFGGGLRSRADCQGQINYLTKNVTERNLKRDR
jgi:hypothetical protein